jgi:hypothetical protein
VPRCDATGRPEAEAMTTPTNSEPPMSFAAALLTDDEALLLRAMDETKTSEELAAVLLNDALSDQPK